MKILKTVAAVLLAGGLLASGTLFAQNVKIAVMSSNDVLGKSVEGKKVIAQLDTYKQNKQKELDSLQKDIAALDQKLASQGASMNEKTRLDLSKDIDAKKMNFQKEVADAQKELETQQNQLLNKVRQDLFPIIRGIRKEKGITIIMEASPAIVDYDETLDITNEVIQRYDKTSASPAAPQKPQPAAKKK
jgi:outer membrane protein